jgi:hypothetical protein
LGYTTTVWVGGGGVSVTAKQWLAYALLLVAPCREFPEEEQQVHGGGCSSRSVLQPVSQHRFTNTKDPMNIRVFVID